MILFLDTATPLARLTIVDATERYENEWQADRQLAKGLLAWVRDQMHQHGASWQDVEGIGVYAGPGSFTGLRIGLTVMNTLAESLHVPIVGVTGDDWQDKALQRLQQGENDKIVLPLYDRDATITTQRK